MQKMSFVLRWMLAGMALVFLLGGCSSIDDLLFGEDETLNPAELMTQGIERMDKAQYKAAVESFQMIKDRYPYSKYAVMAELRMADALYQTEEYDAAYEAYDQFERLHPKNKQIPYVVYKKGMCHFLQMSTNDREQTHTFKAKEEFERLIRRFPKDDYAYRARKNIRKCLIFLSEYELVVGHFYFKMGKYQAAMARYSYIVYNYPDMGQYNEALEYISRCKQRLAEEAVEAAEAAKKEG